jgi:hypothetical protein
LTTSAVVLSFATVLSRLAMLEWQRDRMSVLAAHAEQLLTSAQAWSRLHDHELASGRAIELVIDGLFPLAVEGRATLKRIRAGDMSIDVCEVRVERGPLHVTRRGSWLARQGSADSTLPLATPWQPVEKPHLAVWHRQSCRGFSRADSPCHTSSMGC